MNKKVEFPEWQGYKDIEGIRRVIEMERDPKLVLEYAAKMSIERDYFFNILLFLQYRIQKYFEGEGLGLGIDSSKEIFEGLMIVPAEDVSFPDDKNSENDKIDDEVGNDEIDKYEIFVRDMDKAGIVHEEYHGRFFYHGPAVRTDEDGFPTREDVIRATKVKLQWDNLGLDFIVYPE